MNGVVALLDKEHERLVEEIWAELKEQMGLSGIYITPYPHFSFHVAEQYDLDQLKSTLAQAADEIGPFEVTTSGLGIFTGGLSPILYVSVTRSPLLSDIHEWLWSLASAHSAGIVEYYHPRHWVPHITLGHGDITTENLADTIRLLKDRDFNWQIKIDNLSLLVDTGDGRPHRLHQKFSLDSERSY
jgi:2'-5' RNA ligase